MLHTLAIDSWIMPFSTIEQASAIEALENGQVIYLPQLLFPLSAREQSLLTPDILEGSSKNISFNPKNHRLKGAIQSEKTSTIIGMMERFFKDSRELVERLFVPYQHFLEVGRTSYRPIEVCGRASSLLKDDRRLHVDAFPATPNHGKRILRIFSNINPHQEARVWHLGEPFDEVISQFFSKLRKPLFGSRALLAYFKITKSYRTLYDHYMLMLHNEMKKSEDYQNKVRKTVFPFPAGSTWIVMTDAVSHAALSGQYLLEQTFYLPVEGMLWPQKSPLKILEKFFNKELMT